MHHKLIVIDERVVVAGSFNYTQPANEFDDETLFVIGSVFPEVGKNRRGRRPMRGPSRRT